MVGVEQVFRHAGLNHCLNRHPCLARQSSICPLLHHQPGLHFGAQNVARIQFTDVFEVLDSQAQIVQFPGRYVE